MAKTVIINGVTYSDVPSIQIPLATPPGDAEFFDVSDATINSAGQMLNGVTSYGANGTKYTGNIITKTSSDLSVSGDTVTVPAGYYASNASQAVAAGSVTAPASITGTSATVSTSTNAVTLSKTISVTPNVTTAGYITAGTAGNASVQLTASIPTKGATTYTPTTSNQTITSGTYLTGTQTILGDVNLQSQYIKSGISIFNTVGSLTAATVSQDAGTKVLTIS